MKYLYKREKPNLCDSGQTFENMEVHIFTPSLFKGVFIKGEKKSFKLLVTRLLFQISTKEKAKIYYVTQNDSLVHTSYVIPKCSKFPFLDSDDYEIGPCFTYPEYRGKGIYPQVIRYICNSVGTEKSSFYMIVDENNAASIKGIEKAGFIRCGNVKITGIMKKYQACYS